MNYNYTSFIADLHFKNYLVAEAVVLIGQHNYLNEIECLNINRYIYLTDDCGVNTAWNSLFGFCEIQLNQNIEYTYPIRQFVM